MYGKLFIIKISYKFLFVKHFMARKLSYIIYGNCMIRNFVRLRFYWLARNFSADFRRKRNIYARCGFLFSQFSPIEIIVFDKVFLYPIIEDTDFLSSDVKDILPANIFCKVLGIWKLSNWPSSGLNYARFEEFIHIAESVTQIIYAWRIIPHNKIVPNWIEAI